MDDVVATALKKKFRHEMAWVQGGDKAKGDNGNNKRGHDVNG